MRLTVAFCVRLPDTPVMVTVAGPVVAELLAVSVKMLVVVSGLALNDAVTPAGKPVGARVTLPVNPFAGFTVIVLVPPLPCTTLKLPGAADSVKLGGAATVKWIVAFSARPPDVPVTVTVAAPIAAELLAVSVTTLVVVSGFTLNDAVTPAGKAVAVKLTLPVNPFVGFTVIVLVPLPPCTTLKVLGAADSVNPGAVEVTVSANFTGVSPVVDAVIVTVPAWLGVV